MNESVIEIVKPSHISLSAIVMEVYTKQGIFIRNNRQEPTHVLIPESMYIRLLGDIENNYFWPAHTAMDLKDRLMGLIVIRTLSDTIEVCKI